MAAAAAVHPLPTSPPPARRVVAPRVRNRLAAAAAAGAVICSFLASMWFLFGGLLAAEIGRLACGQSCPVVVAANQVLGVAAATLVLLLPFSLLSLALMLMVSAPGAATDIKAAKAPAPKTLAAVAREELRDPLMQTCLALMLFALPLCVGALLKDNSPVKGSRQERMGSLIYEVGALGVYMVDFFAFCPIVIVRDVEAWRMMLACCIVEVQECTTDDF